MDTEYAIQSEVELAQITPFEAFCLEKLEPAYRQVRELVDGNLLMPKHFLRNTARHELNSLDEAVRYWAALRALPSMEAGLRCTREAAEYIVKDKIQKDLGIKSETDVVLRLGGTDPAAPHARMVLTEEDVTETTVRRILDERLGELRTRFESDVELLVDAARWYREDAGKRFRLIDDEMAQRRNSRPIDRAPLSLKEAALLAQKRDRREQMLHRKARGAVKKVTKLFSSLGQEKNLRLFVSGQSITLSHPDSHLKFVLKPLEAKGWLLERSVGGRDHTPYDLAVYTKDDVYLARLCVYISESPVLDQVLALTLFVESGEEMDVLQKANWFSHNLEMKGKVTSWYPELASKYPSQRSLDATDPVNGWLRPEVMLPAEIRRSLNHWEPFKGRVQAWVRTWLEPVTDSLNPLLSLAQAERRAAAEDAPLVDVEGLVV